MWRNKRLTKNVQRVIRRKRAEEARLRRKNQALAIKFIKKEVVKNFYEFILDKVEVGVADIRINIDHIVAGGKAIRKLAWRREYNELVCDKLTQAYPSFEFELKGAIIHVTYNRIKNDT